jgi:protein-disulfide isomerase
MALRVPVTSRDHVLGRDDAPVTLVEYGDYECPYCGMAEPVVKQLLQRFGDRLRFVFRHFPLTEAHPHAGGAAETAEFAGAHGRFWPMHDALYAHQRDLAPPKLFELARAQGLSPVELRDALTAHLYAPRVEEDFIGGVRSGVNGTPGFFINGERHDAGWSFPELARAIEAAAPARTR